MFSSNSRFKYFLYGFSIILGIFLIDVFIEIVAPDIKNYLENDLKISSSIIYSIFGIICLIALFIASKDIWKDSKQKESQLLTENIEPDIKLFFDSLKARYQKRYESKLDGRFEITLEVNKDWNINQPQTYKVNYRDNKNIDEAFKSINEAFERQGRLLIVGSPGSGKTVLLLKLALELLGKDCKLDQKIPVIFNFASWSEDYGNFEDWLIDVLNSGNGLSKDFAHTLLHQNRIIFLLDGLDELARNEETEISHQKRAKCLGSLNDYLRMGRKAVEIRIINPITTNLQRPYQRLLSGFVAIFLIIIFFVTTPVSLLTSLNYLPVEEKEAFKILLFLLCFPLFWLILTPIFLHFYLRLFLWYEGAMPLKYATFLDYAAEARILEKDGGHWRFRHQTLQEHFAKMEI